MQTPLAKSGDLLLCSGTELFGRLIKLFTKSKWTHVGVFVQLEGHLCVIESREPNGVRVVPADFYADYAGEVWAVEVAGYDDATMRQRLLDLAIPRLGEPYDEKEIKELLLHETGVPIERNQFICSVLAESLFDGLQLSLTGLDLCTPAQVALSPRLRHWRQLK